MQPGNRPTGGFGRLLQDILNEMFDTSTRPPHGGNEMSPEQRERQRELRRAQRRRNRDEAPEEDTSPEQPFVTLEQRGLDREEEQTEGQRRSQRPRAASAPNLRNDVRASLSSRQSIRRAIVVSEILGPPKGLKKAQDI